MRIIKPSSLTEWARTYRGAAPALLHWLEVASKANWQSLAEVRRDFPHADAVRVGSLKPVTIFNVAGNNFRLITAIHYNGGRVYLLDFLTHSDYSKGAWKRTL